MLTSLLGQHIKPVSLPVDAAKDLLEKSGMSPPMATLYAELSTRIEETTREFQVEAGP